MLSAPSSSDFLNADRGDLLIRGFWEGSTDTIIDVRVTNLDSKSYKNLHYWMSEGGGEENSNSNNSSEYDRRNAILMPFLKIMVTCSTLKENNIVIIVGECNFCTFACVWLSYRNNYVVPVGSCKMGS